MATRFAPLVLRAALHDLPQNYAQRITLYEGERNFIAQQHVVRFKDFIDLQEVSYDDANMRLFAQSLYGEEKKWFNNIPTRCILNFDGFQTIFLDRWEDKKNPLQIITEYNNTKGKL